jgi:ribonuclease HI
MYENEKFVRTTHRRSSKGRIDDFGVEKVDVLWGKGHVGVEKNEKVDVLVVGRLW